MKLISFFIAVSFAFLPSKQAMANWFRGSDSLNSAHQYLLEGETSKSILAMIEVWQEDKNENDKQHLIKLLSLAINEDCGRSLSTHPFPSWIKSLAVRRESLQTSSSVSYALSVYGRTEKGIAELSFSAWPDEIVHFNETNENDKHDFNYTIEGLSQNMPAGLYKLNIKSTEGQLWSSWILLSEVDQIQKISWNDSKNWRIISSANFKSTCPKPLLAMHLYPQHNSNEGPVWSLEKDTILPTTVPVIDVPSGQYWFTVSLIERRWQGSILFEEIQGIGRIIDVSHLPREAMMPKSALNSQSK